MLVLIALANTACDQLGLDPKTSLSSCLTDKDKENYANLIANEKDGGAKIGGYAYTPSNVPEENIQALADDLNALNTKHDTYRQGFECQYWGQDNGFFNNLSSSGVDVDPDFLDPAKYKAKFKISSADVLSTLGQQSWQGKNVYVFPGISRIPWENASENSKEEAIKRINTTYNEIRKELGYDNAVDLFDPVNDYIYPHATYHQVYISNFVKAVVNPDNSDLQNLVDAMNPVEENVVNLFINRAPDTI